MPNVSVEARLVTSSDGGIVAWTETMEDPRDALEGIREIMADNIADRFASQSSPWGAQWAPWSPVTVSIRVYRGKDLTRAAFGPAGRVKDGGQAITIGFGSNPMPRYFHLGNAANLVFGKGVGPIPARPILPLTSSGVELPDPLRNQIMEAFSEGVREGLRRRGDSGG